MFDCSPCETQKFESGMSSDCMQCRLLECKECIDEKGICGPCRINR